MKKWEELFLADDDELLAEVLEGKDLNTMDFVWEGGLVEHWASLEVACSWSATACLRWLLEHGANPDVKRGLHSQHSSLVAKEVLARGQYTNLTSLRLLLDYGAKIRLAFREWQMLLERDPACRSTWVYPDRANMLLRLGAVVDYRDPNCPGDLARAAFVMEHRVSVCRSTCVAWIKVARAAMSKDVRVWFVKHFLWPTRRRPEWTPGSMEMPEGFD